MLGIDFSDWLTALGKFQASVASDLDEIRKQKAEIQQLKNDIFSQVAQGRVIRDDQRLVLSAPAAAPFSPKVELLSSVARRWASRA